MQTIRPVGPGSLADPTALLAEMRDAILELQNPQGPVRFASVLQANLPAAADYEGCVIYVSDLDKLALSDGTTWTDTTGGAL